MGRKAGLFVTFTHLERLAVTVTADGAILDLSHPLLAVTRALFSGRGVGQGD